MGGVGSGGARPGSGRKRQETVVMQGNRRDALLDVVTEKLWRATVRDWFAVAKATGNYGLLFPLLPYLMGAAKQEVRVTGQIEHVQMESARKVLRIVGGTEREAAS
jgi:hypothetical protein